MLAFFTDKDGLVTQVKEQKFKTQTGEINFFMEPDQTGQKKKRSALCRSETTGITRRCFRLSRDLQLVVALIMSSVYVHLENGTLVIY